VTAKLRFVDKGKIRCSSLHKQSAATRQSVVVSLWTIPTLSMLRCSIKATIGLLSSSEIHRYVNICQVPVQEEPGTGVVAVDSITVGSNRIKVSSRLIQNPEYVSSSLNAI
jgi:hypothetical protein